MGSSMFLKRVNLVFGDLTATEELLAKYISDNSKDITGITSSELAERVGVAQSTVIKFSKKLGYSNFRRMINDISISSADEFVDDELDFTADDESTLHFLGTQYKSIFDLTASINKIEDVKRATDFLYNAERIIVFGYTPRKANVADTFVTRLNVMGKDAYSDEFTASIYAKLRNCHENDAIVLLSDTGETRETINFARIARKKGVKVITVTRVAQNTLSEIADVSLHVVEYGSRTVVRNMMMMFSYNIVLDLLYSLLFKRNPEFFLKNSGIQHIETKLNYWEP